MVQPSHAVQMWEEQKKPPPSGGVRKLHATIFLHNDELYVSQCKWWKEEEYCAYSEETLYYYTTIVMQRQSRAELN